jgi:carboxypeptidase C (cathepsin A)
MGLVDKAKDAAKKASDAAQKGATEAKDKAHDFNLKRQVNSLAQELGHLVVRQRDGEAGLDAEIDRLVSEIRAVQAEIEGFHDD